MLDEDEVSRVGRLKKGHWVAWESVERIMGRKLISEGQETHRRQRSAICKQWEEGGH